MAGSPSCQRVRWCGSRLEVVLQGLARHLTGRCGGGVTGASRRIRLSMRPRLTDTRSRPVLRWVLVPQRLRSAIPVVFVTPTPVVPLWCLGVTTTPLRSWTLPAPRRWGRASARESPTSGLRPRCPAHPPGPTVGTSIGGLIESRSESAVCCAPSGNSSRNILERLIRESRMRVSRVAAGGLAKTWRMAPQTLVNGMFPFDR